MKGFFKTTLAVMLGVFIMSVVGFVLFIFVIGAVASAGDAAPVLPRSGVLRIDMSEISIAETASADSDLQSLVNGNGTAQLALWDVLQSIDKASQDPAVSYIYLKPDGAGTSLAQTEELRKALSDFRHGGKPVISFIEMPDTRSYYLASVADKVYMSSNAGATPMMVGIGTQLIFLKDLLDRLGVNVQLIRHGKYKSAGEMYIRNSPSAENLEQNQAMVNSLWQTMADDVAASRGISPEEFSSLIENLELNDASDMLAHSLVDGLVSREEIRDRLAELAVVESFKDVKMISFADYVKVHGVRNVTAKQKIAVIYADGQIVDGSSSSNVAGDRFASIISDVRKDDAVKAVVLRVASPGGSVVASDKIRAELELLGQEKPLVASYGEYAASGGYWISAGCDRIFSDRTTLTGSIGCFSMIPDFSSTAKDKLHVGVSIVSSSSHGGMYSGLAPLSGKETAYMQKSIETIYDRFVSIVSDGRKLEPDYVDSIAQGRVWTGSDALRIGLVDETGTLHDALRYAAMCASEGDSDLNKWNIEAYPKPMSMVETLMSLLKESAGSSNDVLAGTPFASVGKAFRGWSWENSEHNYARMPYEFVIR